jgi:hypothetical protein
MGLLRFFKYKYLLNNRRKKYASLALSIALAHASFGQAQYKSIGNGLADITLTLEDNQKFNLNLNDLAGNKNYTLAGKWTLENDQYVLRFNRARKNLNDLFHGSTGFATYAEVQDKRTIIFPQNRAGLMINGIFCSRYLA